VADVMNLLGQLRDGFFSVLLVEQDLGAALSVADRVAVLDRGMVVRQSAATNLDRATLEELLVPSAR